MFFLQSFTSHFNKSKKMELLWQHFNIANPYASILQMVSLVAIDAIIYLLILGIAKENLVYSFIRRDKKEQQSV